MGQGRAKDAVNEDQYNDSIVYETTDEYPTIVSRGPVAPQGKSSQQKSKGLSQCCSMPRKKT
jgi:hypothetical protein